ncbi:17426_t:CDS:2, partial [Dentiscutata heterogama]
TLQGLIQQTKLRERPTNQLKVIIEEGASKNSKDKSTSANVCSRD